jgi:hypothetical protein
MGPLYAFEIEEIDLEPKVSDTNPDQDNPGTADRDRGNDHHSLMRRRPVKRPVWLKDYDIKLPDHHGGSY